ncbi:MAG: phosphoenolpyruvate carboxylase, partial [Acetobacteraceae bacterium]|nr:phosphoenolpyruvate carboxylase [Acetobacteraceae bacterium]
MDEQERALAEHLLRLTSEARERLEQDPFGNPVLAMSLAISRMIDTGVLNPDRIGAVIRLLRNDAYVRRAARLAAYVGGTDLQASTAAMHAFAARLARPDPLHGAGSWDRYRGQTERTRFAAVFTAHPTFSMPWRIAQCLADLASGGPAPPPEESHRPGKPTLEGEFRQACAAIETGRDAIDQLCAALLGAAREAWPDRWTTLVPHPVILTSWVGYDTDGRTDIAWWDTLRLRLRMKSMQLRRLAGQVRPVAAAAELWRR